MLMNNINVWGVLCCFFFFGVRKAILETCEVNGTLVSELFF